MNVLSLFDGISVGMLALERAGKKVTRYIASEINPYAIRVSRSNYKQILHAGDVRNITLERIGCIPDLLIGGSPCQSFSDAGSLDGFEGKSGLFWEYVRVLKLIRKVNPNVKFLFENVSMRKRWEHAISIALGVKPIKINSALVSAQNRERLYWTNIEGIEQPDDQRIYLYDILESGYVDREKSYCIEAGYMRATANDYLTRRRKQMVIKTIPDNVILSDNEIRYMDKQVSDGRTHWDFNHHSDTDKPKSASVVANFAKGIPYNVIIDRRFAEEHYRKFTVTECERLQTLPDGYTQKAGLSNSRCYECIGNGWTADVIAHIFSYL